jgi:riboflavin kinase/FMN adenylyltransferase
MKVYRKIVKGEKRGKRMGFPTLNFILKRDDKIKRGVWVVKLKNGKKTYFAVANVGKAKTFDGKEEKIEVHLFEGKTAKAIKKAEIHFLKYLRKTNKFKTIEGLKKQIKNDIKKAKLLFMSLKK